MMRGSVKSTYVAGFALATCALGLAAVAACGYAQDKAPSESHRAQYLSQMKVLAESTTVKFKSGQRKPNLLATPVFRYDDQPLRFIDATMWVWTDRGRPVAFEKIEAMIHRETGEAQWGYCFT